MENIGILPLSSQRGRCRTTPLGAGLQSTRVQTPLSSSIKYNVLRERLSEESQNIPGETLKRRGVARE
jgi:hypothetical protein